MSSLTNNDLRLCGFSELADGWLLVGNSYSIRVLEGFPAALLSTKPSHKPRKKTKQCGSSSSCSSRIRSARSPAAQARRPGAEAQSLGRKQQQQQQQQQQQHSGGAVQRREKGEKREKEVKFTVVLIQPRPQFLSVQFSVGGWINAHTQYGCVAF